MLGHVNPSSLRSVEGKRGGRARRAAQNQALDSARVPQEKPPSNLGCPQLPYPLKKKTLLFIIGVVPSKLGGIELFAREMAVQLHGAGWKTVLCFEADPAPIVRDAFDLPDTILAPIPSQGSLQASGILRYCQLLREHRPDVVVYSFNSVFKPYGWLAHAFLRTRVFYNDHTSWRYSTPPSRLRRALEGVAGTPLEGVVCVSQYVQRRAISAGWIAPERVHCVYNGVELNAQQEAEAQARAFRERYRIPPGRRIVTQTSWLIKHKGIDKFLLAAARVLAEVPDVQFVLVGEGEERPEFERLARDLGIADHVTWTGAIERPTREGVFAAADVCCQLSQWQEAFGLTIAEAMSFGCPVVATRVGGIPELVQDGETGFLVECDDVPGIARRIVQLLADEDLRRRLGQAGRKVAEKKFDLTRTVHRYLEIFGVLPVDKLVEAPIGSRGGVGASQG